MKTFWKWLLSWFGYSATGAVQQKEEVHESQVQESPFLPLPDKIEAYLDAVYEHKPIPAGCEDWEKERLRPETETEKQRRQDKEKSRRFLQDLLDWTDSGKGQPYLELWQVCDDRSQPAMQDREQTGPDVICHGCGNTCGQVDGFLKPHKADTFNGSKYDGCFCPASYAYVGPRKRSLWQ